MMGVLALLLLGGSQAEAKEGKVPTPGEATATVSSFDASKQYVVVTIENAKFAASLSAMDVTGTILSAATNLRARDTSVNTTASIFVNRISDTVAHVGVQTATETVVVNNLTYSFTFQKSAFQEDKEIDTLKDNKVVIDKNRVLKAKDDSKLYVGKISGITTALSKITSATFKYHDQDKSIFVLEGEFLALKGCTDCDS